MGIKEFDAQKVTGVKIIKSQRFAGWLMYNGCRLLRIERSRNNPRFNVFIFESNDRTLSMVDFFLEQEKKKGNHTEKQLFEEVKENENT